MKTKLWSLSLAVVCLGVVPAMASMTYSDGGTALQSVLNGVTTGPNAGVSSVDVVTDPRPDGADAYWHITATGGSVATMVTELSGGSLGVFNPSNPSQMVPLFSGSEPAGSQAFLSVKADGSVWVNFVDSGVDFASGSFGYYLDTRQATFAQLAPGAAGNLWYSDTMLNADGDHMVAIQGTNTDTVQLSGLEPGLWTNNEYVLGFEALPLASSGEYANPVVMVESVRPVPAPAAVLLGLLGMGMAGLKLRRFA